MVKLFVLFDDNDKVLAHTRDEELFKKYYLSLKKTKNKFPRVVTNKDYVKEIEDTYYKKVLWYHDDIDESDTEDNKSLYDMAKEEYSKLGMLVKDLKNIVQNYNISKKERKTLQEALDILKDLKKKKKFKKAIGTDVVSDIAKNSMTIDLTKIFDVGNDK